MANKFINDHFLNKFKASAHQMKKFLLFFVVTTTLASCNFRNQKQDENEKPVVTVSIIPLKTFVEEIAGDDFTIQVLVPQGASPETYSLLPSQLKQISQSKAWFRLGFLEFELALWQKLQQMNRNMKVVDLSKNLNLIVGKEIKHGDHVHLEGVDPHTWMSPKLVKIMAGQIVSTLSELNEENQVTYQANYEKFINEIDELDAKIEKALADYKGRTFVAFHPSLSYFARDYGLVQYPLELDGKEPTTQHMIEVVDIARREKIKAIFIQNEFDIDHAKVFAEEINGEIVEIKPLDAEWNENIWNLTQLLIENF